MPTEPLQSLPSGTKVLGTKSNSSGGAVTELPAGTQVKKVVDVAPSSGYNHIDDFDPKPKAEKNWEPILNEIVRTAKGGEMGDNEKNILRDILTNPNTTPEQAKEAIQTVQGYHPKQKDNEYAKYYLQKDSNGVLMPKPLAYGERPPEGYDVASAWRSPKQAKDDAWYTDVAKTLVNGVLEGAKGAVALGQLGYNAIADEDSSFNKNSFTITRIAPSSNFSGNNTRTASTSNLDFSS